MHATGITDATLIRTLRLRSARGDTALTSAALTSLDLRPPGLPSCAVLLVRRLEDPLPGRLPLRRPEPAPPAWLAAARGALEAATREAARPAQGPVPAGARAVLFTDRAELLACLARDWVAGDAAQRWWWKALLPRGLDAAGVARLWLEHVPFVPAALHALQAQQAAAPFLRRLEAPAVGALVNALATRHGLGALHEALAGGGISAGHPPRAGGTGKPPRAAGPPVAPWRNLVAATEATALDAPRQFLLGLAVTLHQAPARARAPEFAAAVARWLREGGTPARPPRPEPVPAAPAPGAAVPAVAAADAPPSRTTPPMKPGAPAAGAASVPAAPPPVAAEAAAPPAPEARAVPAPASPPGTRPAVKAPPIARTPRAPGLPAATAPRPFAEGDAGETLHTGFAGIFFLANVALHLDLYGDFSRPLHRGLELPFWDFLALAGEALAGPALRDDPVWALLARLSGRPAHRAPGRGWQPPDEWRIPPEWLASFPPQEPCRWQARHGRLRVMHAAGFPILDLPLRGRTAARLLATEWQCDLPLAAEPSRCAASRAGTTAPARLRRWLGWLTPCLRARLGLALGLPGGEDPGRFLCRQAGKVVTGTAALDVHLSLDAHPIEIRIAGLDRDPGWIPAAGRSLRFHFD